MDTESVIVIDNGVQQTMNSWRKSNEKKEKCYTTGEQSKKLRKT